MRRKILIITVLAMLVGASAAYAALNTYGGSGLTFSPSKAGSSKHPSPLGLTETLKAQSVTSGNRAAPLIDIKTWVYGLVSNAKGFPTCTNTTKMVTLKTDSFCPKGALVASGPVTAILGGTDLSQPGGPCNTLLHVWNAGKGKLWFFFTTDAHHVCGSLHTGDTPPYPGKITKQGKYLVTDVPLPPFVSTAVAHHTGLYGSLVSEKLTYRKLTKKIGGKTVGYQSSVACQSGKRPWKIAFTATDSSHHKETKTVTGSSKC